MKLKNNIPFLLFLFFIGKFCTAQNTNLWVTLNPNIGHASQIDEDITINNGSEIKNYAAGTITCSQSTVDQNLIYSITYSGSDLDNDGSTDELSFDLTVKGYTNATYNYSTDANTSSVTDYGTQSDITTINNTWGVFGDYDIDAGESLVFEIKNLEINGLNSDFSYDFIFSNINFIEPNAGRDHLMIFGFGNFLESLEIDSDKSITPSNKNEPLSITGAGSYYPGTHEWSIASLSFHLKITGPNNDIWDVTDYSDFEKGPDMYHNYPTQTEQKTTTPKFSWNKIPRWVVARSTEPFSEQELVDITDNYQLIMLEKSNQQGFEYIEDGIENAATRLKALNPNITTLFYFNTYINYKGYRANTAYETNAASWSTYETNEDTGLEEIYLFKDLYYWFNQDIEEMRTWWIDTCVGMASLDVIDGVFVDKVLNPNVNGDFFDENGAPINNYTKMLNDLSDQLPDNKLLVGNTLRNERPGGSRGFMQVMDGSYLERWDVTTSGQSEADAIAISIQLMREALQKGKMINITTTPSHSTDEVEPTDEVELLAYIKENVHFPLAVFLIIVEENAYFNYKTGVNALSTSSDIWDTSFVDEFQYYLGEPLSDPTKNGYLYQRSFENLDVWVNIETKETGFNWKDKTLNPDSEVTLDDGNIWYHNYSTSDFNAEYEKSTFGNFEFNETTISTNGNSSTNVSKFTKTSGTHSIVKFKTPNNLDASTESIFKIKMYTETNTTSTNNNIRVILRKDNNTTTQLSKTLTITKMDSWEDYTFDFSNVPFTEDYYNQIHIFFASPDTDNDAEGNVYYIDAFQGPKGKEILAVEPVDNNTNLVYTFPNPVTTNFRFSEKIISANIYNTLGVKVKTFSDNKTQYNITNLPEGIYYIEVLLENNKKQLLRIAKN